MKPSFANCLVESSFIKCLIDTEMHISILKHTNYAAINFARVLLNIFRLEFLSLIQLKFDKYLKITSRDIITSG